jgi:hypothetical protein
LRFLGSATAQPFEEDNHMQRLATLLVAACALVLAFVAIAPGDASAGWRRGWGGYGGYYGPGVGVYVGPGYGYYGYGYRPYYYGGYYPYAYYPYWRGRYWRRGWGY